ncbi:MAG: D-alanyl-D-alanine endopeptidase [Alcaligenaceae bacterium]|nr:D-alanyl-D-alanine endopeptidase [Alcaligenaceae bacterium]
MPLIRKSLLHRVFRPAFIAVAAAFGLNTLPAIAQTAAQPQTIAFNGFAALDAGHAHATPGKTVYRTRLVTAQNLQPVSYGNSSHGDALSAPGGRGETAVDPLPGNLAKLRSEAVLVQDLESATVLYDKNGGEVRPIASISKLMTALVVAEAGLPMDEMLQISEADIDRLKHSRSRLAVGTRLSRADMLHLALMSSENRAAHALGRYYPGGMAAFVRAMNDKARALGMRNTHFVEPTGLSSDNVSTPKDLVKLLRAASKQPLIHRYTTDDKYEVTVGRGRQLVYNNTNRLVRNADWDITVSKTGFINEAGECLVMLTRIDNRDVAIVLLNSSGRYSRIGDAVRIRNLVENESKLAML